MLRLLENLVAQCVNSLDAGGTTERQ
jgi:hypothetical protein